MYVGGMVVVDPQVELTFRSAGLENFGNHVLPVHVTISVESTLDFKSWL